MGEPSGSDAGSPDGFAEGLKSGVFLCRYVLTPLNVLFN